MTVEGFRINGTQVLSTASAIMPDKADATCCSNNEHNSKINKDMFK
jgi:hypothetical protein